MVDSFAAYAWGSVTVGAELSGHSVVAVAPRAHARAGARGQRCLVPEEGIGTGHEESSPSGNGTAMREPTRHCGHRDTVAGRDVPSHDASVASTASGPGSGEAGAPSCERAIASFVATWLDAYRP